MTPNLKLFREAVKKEPRLKYLYAYIAIGAVISIVYRITKGVPEGFLAVGFFVILFTSPVVICILGLRKGKYAHIKEQGVKFIVIGSILFTFLASASLLFVFVILPELDKRKTEVTSTVQNEPGQKTTNDQPGEKDDQKEQQDPDETKITLEIALSPELRFVQDQLKKRFSAYQFKMVRSKEHVITISYDENDIEQARNKGRYIFTGGPLLLKVGEYTCIRLDQHVLKKSTTIGYSMEYLKSLLTDDVDSVLALPPVLTNSQLDALLECLED